MGTEVSIYRAAKVRSMIIAIDEMLKKHFDKVTNEDMIAVGSEIVHLALKEHSKTTVIILCTPSEPSSSK